MTTTPKTRRQLREALKKAQVRAKWYQAAYEEQARALEKLKEQVEADGWTPVYAPRDGFIVTDLLTGKRTDPIVGWEAPDREEHRKAIEDNTRRETLEKVIEALDLKGYSDFKYRTVVTNTMHTEYGANRFWTDLQTTLEHRAAEKHAETQRQTAEKVAGLTKPKATAFTFIPNFGGVAPLVNDPMAGATTAVKVDAEGISISKPSDLVIDFSPEAAKRLAEQIAENLAPKKPAQKKGGKK